MQFPEQPVGNITVHGGQYPSAPAEFVVQVKRISVMML